MYAGYTPYPSQSTYLDMMGGSRVPGLSMPFTPAPRPQRPPSLAMWPGASKLDPSVLATMMSNSNLFSGEQLEQAGVPGARPRGRADLQPDHPMPGFAGRRRGSGGYNVADLDTTQDQPRRQPQNKRGRAQHWNLRQPKLGGGLQRMTGGPYRAPTASQPLQRAVAGPYGPALPSALPAGAPRFQAPPGGPQRRPRLEVPMPAPQIEPY